MFSPSILGDEAMNARYNLLFGWRKPEPVEPVDCHVLRRIQHHRAVDQFVVQCSCGWGAQSTLRQYVEAEGQFHRLVTGK
jgi:hypothetical protein